MRSAIWKEELRDRRRHIKSIHPFSSTTGYPVQGCGELGEAEKQGTCGGGWGGTLDGDERHEAGYLD